jgi:hypothetical protein
MKRALIAIVLAIPLGVPASAAAFHHTELPSTVCAAAAAGSPSNDNGMAKEAITAHNPHFTPPLPPVGTPGNGQGQGGDNCANAETE